MEFKKVLVVGSGTMGNGIAQVCAQKGLSVVLSDISQEVLDKAVKNIRWSVGKFVEKGKLTEDLETIMGRIRTSTGLEAAAEVDLVIEAIFEKLEIKQEVFKKIAALAGDKTISGLQHLGHSHQRYCLGRKPAGEFHRHPFLQSRPHDERRGSHQGHCQQ